MLSPVTGGRRVGEVERVELDDYGPPRRELFDGLRAQAAVRLHLMNVHSVEQLQVLGPRLQEGELVALEVDTERAAEHRERVPAARGQQLDDHVEVAVGLDVGTVAAVQRVRHVVRGVKPGQAGRDAAGGGHGHSCPRTLSGQSSNENPCAANSASVIRSSPNPRHAECAGDPS